MGAESLTAEYWCSPFGDFPLSEMPDEIQSLIAAAPRRGDGGLDMRFRASWEAAARANGYVQEFCGIMEFLGGRMTGVDPR